MKQIINDALKIIAIMEHERLSVRGFLTKYADYFAEVDQHSLIPPECREHDHYSEAAYIFVIGSYLYQRIEEKPVTWMERRRFAKYAHCPELFKQTLCSNSNARFKRISKLKQYLEEVELCGSHWTPEQLSD